MSSDDEIQQIATILATLEPGYLPYPLFQQLARLTALPVIELVPLRWGSDGKVEVLLLARDSDDKIWPGQLHVPGTVIRASDKIGTFETAFNRLLHDELQSTDTDVPVFVANMLNRSLRGTESSQIYWAQVTGDPAVGTFYEASTLPEGTVKTQLAFIERAVSHFKSYPND